MNETGTIDLGVHCDLAQGVLTTVKITYNEIIYRLLFIDIYSN